MSFRRTTHQKAAVAALLTGGTGEAPKARRRSGEVRTAAYGDGGSGNDGALMERIVERSNVRQALKRVMENKGSPGVDGRNVEELPAYLNENWNELK